MARIAEISAQNPWWGQGEEFDRYDQSLGRAKPIFFERRQIGLKKVYIFLALLPISEKNV